MSLQYEKPKDKIYTHEERLKHQQWCFHNDIKIYLKIQTWGVGKIVVIERGFFQELEERYKTHKLKSRDKVWHKEIFKLYTKYYEKYNN